MKHVITFIRPFIAILLVTSVFVACKDDDDPKPTTATIKGVITIENTDVWAVWQDSGEVQVSIFSEFILDPRSGWGVVPDNFNGPGSPGGVFPISAPYNSQNPFILEYEPGVTQYEYELTVDPGEYSALAVGLRHNNSQISADRRTATLGVHYGNENDVSHGIVIRPFIGAEPIFDFPAPLPITVEAGDEVEINFRADFAFVEIWY